jgi:O-antigen ligase
MISEKVPVAELYKLELKTWWVFFKGESFAFKMICGYLFVEYVRPQSILPWLDFLPWAQVFVLGALFGLLMDRDKKWVRSPINKWIVLFGLSILWSCYNAHYPSLSWSNLSSFYTWFIIYFLIINIVTTQQRFIFFLAIFCLASFKISFSLALTWAMRGFAFTSWGLKGPPGFFENSGELAIQMLVFWPIALSVALCLKPYVSKWKHKLLILMPVTAVMVILGASSRGGQLGLLFQVFFNYTKQLLRLRVLFGVLLFGLLAWYFLPEQQKQRFERVGEDRTSQQRLLYWENGLDMMSEFPATGVGFFNFIRYYEINYSDDMLYDNAQLAHNIFIQVGADLGYPGLIIYVLLCFALLRPRKFDSTTESFLVSYSTFRFSLLGFFVAGQFVSVVYYPFLWVIASFISVYINLFMRRS